MNAFNVNGEYRAGLGIQRIEQSISQGDVSLRTSIDIAKPIASIASVSDPESIYREVSVISRKNINPSVKKLDRLRKILEVVEDKYQIDLAHSKFAGVARLARDASSLAGVIFAAESLVKASTQLVEQHQAANQSVTHESEREFWIALALLIVECALFQLPIKFRTAWRGTRYLNNRLLWRLRKISKPLYRIILSEIHMGIQDLTSAVLKTVTDDFINLLASISFRDFWITTEHGGPNNEILQTGYDSVIAFLNFFESHYATKLPDIEAPHISDILQAFANAIEKSSLEIEKPSIKEIAEFIDDI